MFSSPIVHAWIAWLLVIGVIAVLRFAAHQREERGRTKQRQRRRTGHVAGTALDKATIMSPLRKIEWRSIPADYRAQLATAGIIRPATAPESTPDLQIGSDPAINM